MNVNNPDSGLSLPIKWLLFIAVLIAGCHYAGAQSNFSSQTDVEFRLTPAQATVEVDGVPWRVTDGIATDKVFPGTHTWQVAAPGYHTRTGSMEIVRGDARKVIDVKLEPATGLVKINVTPDVAGADIYIDGTLQNVALEEGYSTSAGIHTIKITKNFYELFEDDFTVVEGQTTLIFPEMETTLPKVTVTAPDNAEIWLNGRKLAVGEWQGPLEKGDYAFEARKAGHRSYTQTFTVESMDAPSSFALKAPTPLYGALYITSEPDAAEVTLDGAKVGTTPISFDKVLSGSHVIDFSLPGYKKVSIEAIVERDKTTNVTGDLRPTTEVTIYTRPENATIMLDGKVLHTGTPYVYSGPADTFKMEISAPKYRTQKHDVNLGAEPELHYRLSRQLAKKYDLYLEGGYTFGAFAGISGTLGMHINGFNMEFSYISCTDKSQTIYWNYSGGVVGYTTDECTYKPSYIIEGKLGGGTIAGTRVKITPQMGYRFVRFKETSTGNVHYDGISCSSITLGIRVFCAICPFVGLSVTPEYAIGVTSSEGFNLLNDIDTSYFKNFKEGFNAKAALTIFF